MLRIIFLTDRHRLNKHFLSWYVDDAIYDKMLNYSFVLRFQIAWKETTNNNMHCIHFSLFLKITLIQHFSCYLLYSTCSFTWLHYVNIGKHILYSVYCLMERRKPFKMCPPKSTQKDKKAPGKTTFKNVYCSRARASFTFFSCFGSGSVLSKF